MKREEIIKILDIDSGIFTTIKTPEKGFVIIITKSNAYVCPNEHITSHFEKQKRRVIYNSHTAMRSVGLDQMPLTMIHWINKHCPEIHSKNLFFGMTKGDNPTSFCSKRV